MANGFHLSPFFSFGYFSGKKCTKKSFPCHYTGAHKNVIKEITIMASVRQGWQRKAIELFAAFKYNYLKSILWQYDRGADSQHRSEKAANSICSELP